MTCTLTHSLATAGAALSLGLAPAALPSPALGGGRVWVVDDDGGAGVDFADLQPAVNAAAEGDVLLVKPGEYGSFAIHGKSVHIAAEQDGTVRCHGGFTVRGLAASQPVTVRGVRVADALEDGIQVLNCAGEVWIEACTLAGNDGDGVYLSPGYHPQGHDGARVSGSSAVAFVRCTLLGGMGADYAPLFSDVGPGGHGTSLDEASVALYECTLVGATGGSVLDDDAAWTGAGGGHGVAIDAGFLFTSGTELRGGDGGYGGEDYDPFLGYSCGDGGPGGFGVHQENFGTGPAAVHLLDCTLTGGVGGPPMPGSGCSQGPPGGDVSVPNGTVQHLAGASQGYSVSSPRREGETLTLSFQGEPGDVVVLAIAGSPGFLFQPGLSGVLLVDLAFVPWLIGVIQPDGMLTSQVAASVSVAQGQAKTYSTQTGVLSPSTLTWTLGAGSWLVVLDQGL